MPRFRGKNRREAERHQEVEECIAAWSHELAWRGLRSLDPGLSKFRPRGKPQSPQRVGRGYERCLSVPATMVGDGKRHRVHDQHSPEVSEGATGIDHSAGL